MHWFCRSCFIGDTKYTIGDFVIVAAEDASSMDDARMARLEGIHVRCEFKFLDTLISSPCLYVLSLR